MINLAMTGKGFVMVLKTNKDDKVVPILVATIEAQSIVVGFLQFKQSRPLSHDVLKDIILSCGISLKYIFIDSVKNDIFTAKIIIQHGNDIKTIDSRPSDAVALALRLKGTIFIDESVVDSAGIFLEDLDEISLNGEIPFKYANFDEYLSTDMNISDMANIGGIANTSNALFKKYSDLELSSSENKIDLEMPTNEYHSDGDLAPGFKSKDEMDKYELEQLLRLAIEEERYEDAANYRDELNKYKDN